MPELLVVPSLLLQVEFEQATASLIKALHDLWDEAVDEVTGFPSFFLSRTVVSPLTAMFSETEDYYLSVAIQKRTIVKTRFKDLERAAVALFAELEEGVAGLATWITKVSALSHKQSIAPRLARPGRTSPSFYKER